MKNIGRKKLVVGIATLTTTLAHLLMMTAPFVTFPRVNIIALWGIAVGGAFWFGIKGLFDDVLSWVALST